nr:GNAT family N-acetyltransferase [Brevibacterium permense]
MFENCPNETVQQFAGHVDFDPAMNGLPAVGDVNIAYSVHPWARGQGVATVAVGLICDFISRQRIGTRAIARIEAENFASTRVVERNGFQLLGQFQSIDDQHDDGSPVVYATYSKEIKVG